MAREPKPASADDVRAWAQETGWLDRFNRPVSDRGRMPTDLIEAFDRAHRRNNVKYMAGYKPQGQPGKEVAARRESAPAKTTAAPAKATATKATAKTEAAPEQRVSSVQRVNGSDTGIPQITESLADAIAMLSAAKSAKKQGEPPTLVAFYTLV